MKLGTVKRILLVQQLESYWPVQTVLQLAPQLWQAQSEAQSGIESLAVKWAQSTSYWSKLKMEDSSIGSDLGSWERPEICATFVKLMTDGQPYYSTLPIPETIVFRTQEELIKGW
jgi:hypothetical protein